MTRASYRRVQHQVKVREPIYQKLKALAQKNGEHVSTTLDAIILAYLDKRAGEPRS